MESAGYLRYRAETPMVIVRAIRRIPEMDWERSMMLEFTDGHNSIRQVRLPRKLIEIWRYRNGDTPVLEVELPRWLAERVGLI